MANIVEYTYKVEENVEIISTEVNINIDDNAPINLSGQTQMKLKDNNFQKFKRHCFSYKSLIILVQYKMLYY